MRAYWTLFCRNLKKGNLPFNTAIISDILLWMVLLALLLGGIYLFTVQLPEQRGQTIRLHFKDANEIIKGSSVHMMGTEIGYVRDLHVHKDHVTVTVQTYPESLSIPAGATFTVLFTGLGGSKSIEVELPKSIPVSDSGEELLHGYLVQEPVRFKQVLDANIDVTRALQQGAENIADFFGKKKPVEELQFNIRQTHHWTEDSIHYADEIDAYMVKTRQDLHQGSEGGHGILQDLRQQLAQAKEKTRPARVRPHIEAGLGHVRDLQEFLVQAAAGTSTATGIARKQSGQISMQDPQTKNIQEKLNDFNRLTAQVSTQLRHVNAYVRLWSPERWLTPWEKHQEGFARAVDRSDSWLDAHPLSPALQKAKVAIQRFNQQLLGWLAKMTSRQGTSRQGTPASSSASPSSPQSPPLSPLKPLKPLQPPPQSP